MFKTTAYPEAKRDIQTNVAALGTNPEIIAKEAEDK
jgi:hypothetical protein